MVSLRNFALAIVVTSLTVSGCTTKPAENNNNAAPSRAQSSSKIETEIVPGSIKDFQVNVGDTVHFDYDRSNVRESDRTTLERQAAWLNRYPSIRVTVEGNCDERGTRAYNLALGARRAENVKEFLVSEGVSRQRIGTISYGKERPVCTESDDECWARNRRAVTVISSSPG